MEKKTRNSLVSGLAGLLFLVGCGDPVSRPASNPYSEIRRLGHYHWGIKEWKDDVDFDSDGKTDTYVIMNDGVVYARYSGEFYKQVADKVENPVWTWHRVE